MNQEAIEKLKQAGKIASEARSLAKDITKPGSKTLDIVNEIENFIRSKGAEPAFPVNVSINDIAAHSTPESNSDTIIKEDDMVKIDIGTHIDGYIADTAITICSNPKYNNLVNITKEAVENALKIVKPGIAIDEISKVIEKTIRDAGFNPVVNLTGHAIERHVIHAGSEIPNVSTGTDKVLQKGQVIAIEPFATTGEGRVKEIDSTEIFSQEALVNTRNEYSRKILKGIEQFDGMPFCQRWIDLSPVQFKLGMRELTQKRIVAQYPVLREVSGALVSQHEHTVIVLDEPIVTTL